MKDHVPAKSSLPKRLMANLRAGDWLIVILFILLATGSFWAGEILRGQRTVDQVSVAVVTVSNQSVAAVNLQKPSEFSVQGTLGEVILRVANNRIRVLRSSCPNQVCVRQKDVYRPGEMLVCVPNHLVVFVSGEADSQITSTWGDSAAVGSFNKLPVKNRGDAVTY